jgi:hypothetical protein
MQTQIDIAHPGADPGVPATAITSTSIYALLAGVVQAGIDLLDALEASQEDLEPSLAGSSNGHYAVDAEGDDADLELSGDESEPSLGSIGSCYSQSIPQTDWGHGCDDAEDEHDGAEPDEDASDATLGATHALNQEIAWTPGGRLRWGSHPTCESEPSLGWSIERGHPEPVAFGGNDDREQDVGDEGEADSSTGELEEDGHFLHCGGGDLPCLDQTVEIGGAAHELAREQAAMRAAAKRLAVIVARVRAAGDTLPPGAGQAFAEMHAGAH